MYDGQCNEGKLHLRLGHEIGFLSLLVAALNQLT
jgi:hypothetical protein